MAAQRYETVIKDTDTYYSSNCPIVLAAYAVLFDTKKQKYMAQLKLRNCSSETISSVSVIVRSFDHFESVSEEVEDCQFTDVNAGYGEEFGTKTLIPLLKDVKIKKLGVAVNKIVFTNGNTWDAENGEFLSSKLVLKDLSSVFSTKDIENYRFLLGSKMQYVPFQKDKLWECSCGAVNFNCDTCNDCGADSKKVLSYIDKSNLYQAVLDPKYNNGIELKEQRTVESLDKAAIIFEELGDYKNSKDLAITCRQEIEAIKRAIAEKKQEEERQAEIRKAEEEKQAEIRRLEAEQKSKKNKRLAIIVAALAVLCFVAFFVVTKVIIPNNKYNTALQMIENGDYSDAIKILDELGGYKDSAEKKKEANNGISYDTAISYMQEGDYEHAIEYFNKSNGFSDSDKKIEECYSNIVADILSGKENALQYLHCLPKEEIVKNSDSLYSAAETFVTNNDLESAQQVFSLLGDYEKAKQYLSYIDGKRAYQESNWEKCIDLFSEMGDFLDSQSILTESVRNSVFNGTDLPISVAIDRLSEIDDEEAVALLDRCEQIYECQGTYGNCRTVDKESGKTKDTSSTAEFEFFVSGGKIYGIVNKFPSSFGGAFLKEKRKLEVLDSTDPSYDFMFLDYATFPSGRKIEEYVYFDSSSIFADVYMKVYYYFSK